ncbi:MAG: hypothetical protein M3094_05260 [Actinomycetia bacterium]|nr:hypothetical protein [Actinomycetes bacterium]
MTTTLPQTPGTDPGRVRPPTHGVRVPIPGVAEPSIRRTAVVRNEFAPVLTPATSPAGYPPTHDYVRRFWIAVLGPGAVADLLRITAAAHSGRSLKEPVHLSTLLAAGLVLWHGKTLAVPDTVPPVPRHIVARFPPALRRAHAGAELRGTGERT